MTLVRGRPSTGSGGGIDLTEIPGYSSAAPVDTRALRSLGADAGEALDAATADGLYEADGTAQAILDGLDPGAGGERVAARWKGAWAPATAYLRGDVVYNTPSWLLRQATLNHTSGGSFVIGNEYATTNQWVAVSFPGFRGLWVADAWYPQGHHVISPLSGQIVQSKVSHAASVFDAAKFGPSNLPAFPSALRPDELIPLEHAPEAGWMDTHGLWPVGSCIRYPSTTRRLATFETTADFTTITGAGTADADPDPVNPNGSVRLRGNVTATKTITPTDLSDVILRLVCKGDLANRGNVTNCRVELSSNNFATGNYHSWRAVKNTDKHLPDNEWDHIGCGLVDLEIVGSGANLALVNAIRVRQTTPSGSWDFSVAHLDAVPNTSMKASCSIWFDDNYLNGLLVGAGKMLRKGFRGVIASSVNGAFLSTAIANGQIPASWLRRLIEFHHWQLALHAYSTPEHNDVDGGYGGPGLRSHLMNSRHAGHVLGSRDTDDFAWFGNIVANTDTMEAVRKYTRSGRIFINQARMVETRPPTNPHRMWGYGAGGQDVTDSGAAMIAYIDKAIEQRGHCSITWHNLTDAGNPDFDAVLAYLDANRDDIDVLTNAEALEPWTVAA